MKGNVLGFDAETNNGAISGHDGERYEFVRMEWRSGAPPRRGAVVDFVPDGGRATQIYPVGLHGNPAEGSTAELVYILYLVSLLVGVTGIVGLIMAYVNHADAPDWVKTHYRFQIRTFWIGLLYGFIGVLTCIIVVGFFWLFFVFVWWIVRCAKGMQALSRGDPYPEPATWWW
jgi:uncharacterized membrane protein